MTQAERIRAINTYLLRVADGCCKPKGHENDKQTGMQEKNKNKKKRIPRWGRVQTTLAEGTRTIKYVLAERSRWLLHRRRDTKINIPGCRKKIKERKEKRKVGSKAQKQASKKIVLKASP